MESIEIFGREVLPEFLERDPAASAAKAERLQPMIDSALARKAEVYQPRDLGDYEFPAIPRQWATTTGSGEMQARLDRIADDRAAGKRETGAGITG